MGLEKLFKNLRVILAGTTLAAGLLATTVLTGAFTSEAQAQDKVAATPQQGLPVTVYMNKNATDPVTQRSVDVLVDVINDYCPIKKTEEPFLLSSGKPLKFRSKFLFHVEGHRPAPFSDVFSGGTNSLRKCAPHVNLQDLAKP